MPNSVLFWTKNIWRYFRENKKYLTIDNELDSDMESVLMNN